MRKYVVILILLSPVLPVLAGETTLIVGEVVNVTTRMKNVSVWNIFTPLEEDYAVIQLADGKNYQLGSNHKNVSSGTVVEIVTKKTKTNSGYPLIISGRTLSLVMTINGEKEFMPLKKPWEFGEIQSKNE